MSPNNLKLLLVEFEDEVFTFRKYCQERHLDSSSFTIVALQPKVRLYVKNQEAQLHCVDTLAYFDNNSHQRALEKSHELAQSLAASLSFEDSLIPHTLRDTFIYYARFYINNYLRLLEILRGIQDAHGGGNIEIFAVNTESTGWGSAFLTAEDRFLFQLTRNFCAVHDIPFTAIPGNTAGASEPGGMEKPRVPGMLRKLAILLLRNKLRRLAMEPVIFLSALSYNLDRLTHSLRKRFSQIRAVTAVDTPMGFGGLLKFCIKEILFFGGKAGPGIIPVPMDVLFPGPLGQGAFGVTFDAQKELFVYHGCSIYDIFKTRVERGLMKHLHKLEELALVQRGILELLTPNVVISPVSIDTYMSWAESARTLGIPSLIIPQKGLVAPAAELPGLEQHYIGRAQVTEAFSHAAAQTPYIRDYLKWAEYEGEVLETGSLIFSRINPNTQRHSIAVPEGKHIIVYAPSMKSRKAHRFYVLETLDELMSSIEDVVNAVAALPDSHLVMRIHPGEPVTRKEIEGLMDLPENVTISDSGTFEEVLSAAALTISFSSTSIQESLINGVPVVLYDKWNRYNHLDAPEFKEGQLTPMSSSYYINETERLRPALRWILDNHTEAENEVQLFYDCIFPARYRENFVNFIKESCDLN